MVILETIKSYLVSLGFSVDKSSYHETTKAINNAGESVAKFAGGAVANFGIAESSVVKFAVSSVVKLAVAGAAVSSFVVGANLAIAKFIGSLAQADLANEKLARQMWTSKEYATEFNNTLKAMGASLQDLYLSPELMRNFQALRQQAGNMRPPDEFADQMKSIRSIQFEFTRMKLEATYALQWIGYYFIKYMAGPIGQIKLTLQDINSIIIKTMPSWTRVIAQVMSWFGQMGVTTVRAIKDIARMFNDIGQTIPNNLKLIGAAVLALGLILSTGPLGIFIASLTSAILLLNDFYTYLGGGESALGPLWKKLIDFYDKLKDSGAIDAFKNALKEAFDFVSNAIDTVKISVTDFYKALKDSGAIDNFQKAFENTFGVISGLVNGAIGWIQQMFGELQKQGVLTDLQKSFEDVILAVSKLDLTATEFIKNLLGLEDTKKLLTSIGDILKDYVVKQFKDLNLFLQQIKNEIDAITKLLKGDFKGAGSSFMSGIGKLFELQTGISPDAIFKLFKDENGGRLMVPPVPNYIYPSSNTTHNDNRSPVSLSQTNNIYGSDPKATANAAQDNMYSMYMRNMRGVIV